MIKAVLKSSKMFDFPYRVALYKNGELTKGVYFSTLIGARAYIIANADIFESRL